LYGSIKCIAIPIFDAVAKQPIIWKIHPKRKQIRVDSKVVAIVFLSKENLAGKPMFLKANELGSVPVSL
jgi:hypothetical protein